MGPSLDSSLDFKYNKHYIGMSLSGIANNFVIIQPRKNYVRLNFRIPKSEEITNLVEESGLAYDFTRWGGYRLTRVTSEEFASNIELIDDLLKRAYSNSR